MENINKLLWTSGWDSTFRLLDLVLIQKKRVQPYYVISRSRQSWEVELQTMEKIKSLLFKKAPDTRQLLLPTITKERNLITINDLFTQQYKRLQTTAHLGDQYVYLASYAEESGIEGLELAIHKDDQAHKFLENYVVEEKNRKYYKLKEDLTDSDLALFKYFRFPILNLTKLDMQKLATEHDFLGMMNLTWFCHSPINQKPCGLCVPCRSTMEEGMQRRFPLSSKARYFMHYKVKSPIKKLLKPVKSLF
jgi:hypothetical protein